MDAGLKPYERMKDSDVEWLGEVPEHWEVRSLGRIGTFSKGRGGNKEDERQSGVPCIRYGDLYTTHQHFIHAPRSYVSKKQSERYTSIKYGDVLFAASGETAEEIGKSAVNLIRSEVCCGGDIILFRPNRKISPKFLGYATDSRPTITQKALMGRGFTVVHIYTGQLKRLCLALPSLPEQNTIGRFLDHATDQIERYIRAKKKLIALLEEQKLVIIQDAVTGRIDVHNGKPYPAYKPTGVEWFRNLPINWHVEQLGRIGRFSKGSGGTKADEREDGVPCIRYGDLYTQHQFFVFSGRSSVAPDLAKTAYTEVKHGDLLFAASGETIEEIGKSATNLIDGTACCGGDVIILRPSIDINAKFLGYAADAPAAVRQKGRMGRGFTVIHIYSNALKKLAIPMPPRHEQDAIVHFLDKTISDNEVAKSRTLREIKLLREYRTRLIADVVTGKLDVREAAKTLPDMESTHRPVNE